MRSRGRIETQAGGRVLAGLLLATLITGLASPRILDRTRLAAQEPESESGFGRDLATLLSLDSAPEVRGAVARQLLESSRGDAQARSQLAEAVQGSTTAGTALAIVHVVALLADWDGLLDMLLALGDDERVVGEEPGATLGAAIWERLIAMLEGPRGDDLAIALAERVGGEPGVARATAIALLGQVRPRAALPILATHWARPDLSADLEEALAPVLASYFGGDSAELRTRLVATKAELYRMAMAAGRWQEVAKDLDDEMPEIVTEAITALAQAPDPAALAAITEAVVARRERCAAFAPADPARAHLACDRLVIALVTLWRTVFAGASEEVAAIEAARILKLLTANPLLEPELRFHLGRALVSRPAIARALGEREVLDQLLLSYTTEDDIGRREELVGLLKELGDGRALWTLLADVTAEPPTLRARILASITGYPAGEVQLGDVATAKIIECATQPEAAVRAGALQAMGHLALRTPEAYAATLAMASDPELGALTRAQACRLLGNYDRVEPLVELLASEAAPEVRQQLITQLGRVGSRLAPEATSARLAVLAELVSLPDDSGIVVRASLEAAGDDPFALGYVAEALAARDPSASLAAAERAIGLWQGREAIDAAASRAYLEVRVTALSLGVSAGALEREAARGQAVALATEALDLPPAQIEIRRAVAPPLADLLWRLTVGALPVPPRERSSSMETGVLSALRSLLVAARETQPRDSVAHAVAAGRHALVAVWLGDEADARSAQSLFASSLRLAPKLAESPEVAVLTTALQGLIPPGNSSTRRDE